MLIETNRDQINQEQGKFNATQTSQVIQGKNGE
jgi:hypothetical protein